jgi:tetratricopeptide (TPR) repeat protein
VELDLMNKHKHSPIQEYSETLVKLVRAKMALSEFDDCCLEYINEVRSLLNKAKFNSWQLMEIAQGLASRFKQFEEAIEIYGHVIKICEKSDPIQAGQCLTEMGFNKASLMKYDEGLQKLHDAKNLFQSNGGEQTDITRTLVLIGDLYKRQNKFRDSLKYFEIALEEMSKKKLKVSRRGPKKYEHFEVLQLKLVKVWGRIAEAQCELNMPKTALTSIKKSWNYLRIVDDKKHPKELSNILIIKGRCYRKMGNYKKAIRFT